MPTHYPEHKLEQVVKAWFEDKGFSLHDIYTTWNDNEPTLPSITITCDQSLAQDTGEGYTGNWRCELKISVMSALTDESQVTGEEHIELEAEMRDIILLSDVEQTLNDIAVAEAIPVFIQQWKPTIFTRVPSDNGVRISTQQVSVFLSPITEGEAIAEVEESSSSSS